jgi:4-amino-4-deoxy-L-arabinose transferase-like glycosyltransferase
MSRTHLAFAALLVLALILRLGYVAATPNHVPRNDAENYDWLARNVALTGAYPWFQNGRKATAFRPPAYPYALAAVYKLGGAQLTGADPARWRLARRAQAVLGTLTAALTGLLAWKLWGARAGLVALALAAVFPPLILVQSSLVSEALYTPLVLLAVLTALRGRASPRPLRWALLTGLIAGLSILTRANGPALLVPLALAFWTGRPRLSLAALKAPAALVAVAIVCVLPWTIRNAVVLDAFVPLATQTGPALAGTYNDVSRADPDDPWTWRGLRHIPAYRDIFLRRTELTEVEIDRMSRERALDWIAGRPISIVEVGYWNLRRLFELGPHRRTRETAASIGIRSADVDFATYSFYGAALVGLAGLFTGAARRTPGWVCLVPVLLVASVVFVNAEVPRFRAPLDPWILMFASLALLAAFDRLRRRRTGKAVPA